MPHSSVVIAWCSPIDMPVRGSEFAGMDGMSCVGRIPDSAFSRAPTVLARFVSSSTARNFSFTAIGASEVVSTPAATAESSCPSAILFAVRITVSSPVPHACCTS